MTAALSAALGLAAVAVLLLPQQACALDNGLGRTPPLGWSSWSKCHPCHGRLHTYSNTSIGAVVVHAHVRLLLLSRGYYCIRALLHPCTTTAMHLHLHTVAMGTTLNHRCHGHHTQPRECS